MNLRHILSLLPILFLSFYSDAQKRILVYKTDISELEAKAIDNANMINVQNLKNITDQIVQFYANDDQFTVIDRANLNLIQGELELQKKEQFMDGYIVEQGKQEGADYILSSKYLKSDKSILIKIFDVAKGTVRCERTQKLNTALGLITNVRTMVTKMLSELNATCFEITYPILRSADKKAGKKTKSVLVAVGSNQKIKRGYSFEIYQNILEQVGDQEIARKEVVGEGSIEEIQDQNFSILKIEKGGEQIAQLLAQKAALFCALKQ